MEAMTLDYNNDSGYRKIHRRLRKVRGPAGMYSCISCGEPAECWAYQIDDETGYSDNVEDYAPMCQSCHRKLDWSRRPAEDRAHRMDRAREVRSTIPGISGGPGPANHRCLNCGLTTNAGSLQRHLNATGHQREEG